jgi:hypothetical protein
MRVNCVKVFGVGGVLDQVNLILNLRYPQQVDVESISGLVVYRAAMAWYRRLTGGLIG